MGCWNATCMVSGLPITYGDRVVAFIIKQNVNANWGADCYCYSEAQLLSPPIYGDYNDYGGIEGVVMKPELDQLYKYFDAELLPAWGYDLGVDTDNKFHHFTKKKDLLGVINGSIERGYAAVEDSLQIPIKTKDGEFSYRIDRIKAPVAITFILGDIWSHIQKTMSIERGYNGELLGSNMKENRKRLRESAVWKGMDVDLLSDMSVMDMTLLVYYLEAMRINIRPGTGKGGQNAEFESHIRLYNQAKRIAEAKMKEWDNNEDNDEE